MSVSAQDRTRGLVVQVLGREREESLKEHEVDSCHGPGKGDP